MLYDPKWDAKTKADPLTLEALIAWLEKQPSDGRYVWDIQDHCLIRKYSDAVGCNFYACHSAFFERDQLRIAMRRPHTFGAALRRARAELA